MREMKLRERSYHWHQRILLFIGLGQLSGENKLLELEFCMYFLLHRITRKARRGNFIVWKHTDTCDKFSQEITAD